MLPIMAFGSGWTIFTPAHMARLVHRDLLATLFPKQKPRTIHELDGHDMQTLTFNAQGSKIHLSGSFLFLFGNV